MPFVPGAPLLVRSSAAPAVSPSDRRSSSRSTIRSAELPYVLDVSVAGTSPGVTVAPGVVIPLNPPWLNYETGASLSNIFVNFFGILDAAGHASPYVNVPAIPALAGTVVSATYVAINPASPALIDFIAPPTQTMLAGPAPGDHDRHAADRRRRRAERRSRSPATTSRPGATVQIGGAPATSVTSSTRRRRSRARLPPGTLGPKPVTVTNPDAISGDADERVHLRRAARPDAGRAARRRARASRSSSQAAGSSPAPRSSSAGCPVTPHVGQRDPDRRSRIPPACRAADRSRSRTRTLRPRRSPSTSHQGFQR